MPASTRPRVPLAEERRTPHSRRHPLVWVVLLGVLGSLGIAGYVAAKGFVDTLGGDRCQATALDTSVDFDPEQTANAATIVAIAERRGLPPRAATIALATAIQESKLRNIRYGDRDSLGLFQQRPSQGWGTPEEVLDPDHATNAFYDALVQVEGYETGTITVVAQEVQRSAYPEAYADHEQEGRLLASTLSGYSPGGLACRLDDAGTSDPATMASRLDAELGMTAAVDGGTATVTAGSARLAWSAGAWSVANAQALGITAVQVGDRVWLRQQGSDGWTWQPADDPRAETEVHVTFA